jgi:hypothetical protein
LVATTWLNLMTIGACAEAGPASERAATDAAAKISLRIFPPLDFLEARNRAAPVDVVSGTNTDDCRQRPLPVSRGFQAAFAAMQNCSSRHARA